MSLPGTITSGSNSGTGGNLTLNGSTSGNASVSASASGSNLQLNSTSTFVDTNGSLTLGRHLNQNAANTFAVLHDEYNQLHIHHHCILYEHALDVCLSGWIGHTSEHSSKMQCLWHDRHYYCCRKQYQQMGLPYHRESELTRSYALADCELSSRAK